MGEFVADIVGWLIGDRILIWMARRRLCKHRVRCFLRVESGELPGLTTTWTVGEAHLERGRLAFTRRWPNLGVVTVDVTGIDASGEDVSPRISSGVAPELTVWRLSTATGVLGWRVDRSLIARAGDLLRPREREVKLIRR